MKNKDLKNLAASVRQRLTNVAKSANDDFQYVLTRYALERLLYRLSRSKHAERFVLKGAMLFQLWTNVSHRPTRDLDLLATGGASVTTFEEVFRSICSHTVVDDGLIFDPAAIKGEQIKAEDEYQGIRIRGQASLGSVRIPIQIDIGFGDAITPGPVEIEYPAILEFPAPHLLAYNRETVVAEKFQAMVLLGIANSRMKDFFDVWSLSNDYDFSGQVISAAIKATFERRQTTLPARDPIALTSTFSSDKAKQTQWKAFLRKSSLKGTELPEVITTLRSFLMPPVETLRSGEPFDFKWKPRGPWEI